MEPEPPAVVLAILRRRSVRTGYLADPVPQEDLVHVVRCGLAAPASKAASPWRFTVAEGRDLLDALADDVAAAPGAATYTPHDPRTGRPRARWVSTVAESAEVLRAVPAAILVENSGPFSGGRSAILRSSPAGQALGIVGYELELSGLGAAAQSMWLAANALGLSAVFMGDIAVAEPAIRERLGLAGDLLGALAVGYVAGGAEGTETVPSHFELDPELVRWANRPT